MSKTRKNFPQLAQLIFATRDNINFWNTPCTYIYSQFTVRGSSRAICDTSSENVWQVIYSSTKYWDELEFPRTYHRSFYPNYLVSRLTVCLRDERRVAWNFRAHAHLNMKKHAFSFTNRTCLKKIIYVIFFLNRIIFIIQWIVTTTLKLYGATSPSRGISEK